MTPREHAKQIMGTQVWQGVVADLIDVEKQIAAGISAALEEAAQTAADFDEWVWCKCSECRKDGNSHAVSTYESLKKLAAEIRSLKDEL